VGYVALFCHLRNGTEELWDMLLCSVIWGMEQKNSTNRVSKNYIDEQCPKYESEWKVL